MKHFVGFLVFAALAAALFVSPANVQAQDPTPTPERLLDDAPPGEPAFPVTDRSIPYWIHNCPVSQETVGEVDAKLEELNASRKTQTVILCMPYGEVRDGPIYAISFYNYMQLGYPDFEYRDRGFVWLVQVDETHMKMNYAVGEGLPRLDAGEIDAMRNEATDAYLQTGDLDASLLGLTEDYVLSVSSQYPEVSNPAAPVLGEPAPVQVQGDNGGSLFSAFLIVGLVILAVIILAAILMAWLESGGSGSEGPRTYSDDDGPSYTPTYTPRSTYTPRPRPSSLPPYRPPSRPSSPPSRPSSPPSRPNRTGGGGSGGRRTG